MNPILQDKLLDLLVNIIAIILGGGLITVAIEWRRHRRELQNWQKEDETVQIDVPVAAITHRVYQVTDKLDKDEKLEIYENQLEGTVRLLAIYSEFVIRNTTPSEIVITSYDINVLTIPSGNDEKDFYNSETFSPTHDENRTIRLKAYATLPRVVVYTAKFDKNRKLESDKLPSSLSISVKTSSGMVIQQVIDLTSKSSLILKKLDGKYVPTLYYEQVTAPANNDIPF